MGKRLTEDVGRIWSFLRALLLASRESDPLFSLWICRHPDQDLVKFFLPPRSLQFKYAAPITKQLML
jgi:hypothetical protein